MEGFDSAKPFADIKLGIFLLAIHTTSAVNFWRFEGSSGTRSSTFKEQDYQSRRSNSAFFFSSAVISSIARTTYAWFGVGCLRLIDYSLYFSIRRSRVTICPIRNFPRRVCPLRVFPRRFCPLRIGPLTI